MRLFLLLLVLVLLDGGNGISRNLRVTNYADFKPSPSDPRPSIMFQPSSMQKRSVLPKSRVLNCGNDPVKIYDATSYLIRSENFPKRAPTNTSCVYNLQTQPGVAVDLMCYKLHVPCRKRNYLDISSSLTEKKMTICTEKGVQNNVRIPISAHKQIRDFVIHQRVEGRRAGLGYSCWVRGLGGAQGENKFVEHVAMNLTEFDNSTGKIESRSAMDCGRTRYTRITNGNFASDHEYPWLAQLAIAVTGLCHGTLVNDYWILTSAACAWDEDGNSLKVFLGCTIRPCSTEERTISRIIIPISYYYPYNNIALVSLLRPVRSFSQRISPVCFPKSFVRPGTRLTVSGWGAESQNSIDFSTKLKKATMTVIRDRECPYGYGAAYIPLLCTVKGTGNTCSGDGAAPAVLLRTRNRVRRYVQYGLLISSGCDRYGTQDSPSIFTELPYYVHFIRSFAGPIGTF